MLIEKETAVKTLQEHLDRYERLCGQKISDIDNGYMTGVRFAIKLISLQDEGVLGQITFDWEEKNE